MKITRLLLFLLVFVSQLFAQRVWYNCGTVSMTPQGGTAGCAIPHPSQGYTAYPALASYTYLDQCWDGNGVLYNTQQSTVSGNGVVAGQCMLDWRNHEVDCFPVSKTYMTFAVSQSDYNRMYNQEFAAEAHFNGHSGKGVPIYCEQLTSWEQDERQCPPSGCYSGGGGGGGGGVGCDLGGGGGQCGSPIIIDTIGEGFRLTSEQDGVTFDIRGNKQPVHMAWTEKYTRNAFLCLDRNHNGTCDSGKELFGDYTEQAACPKGDHGCKNGYRALAEFDAPKNGGNGDGIISDRDAVWPLLLLWIDTNHDGISQPEELFTLNELGVYSLSLQYKEEPYHDIYGNFLRYRGKVNPLGSPEGDHVDRVSYDVFFVIAEPQAECLPKQSRLEHIKSRVIE